jgi:hypothetical protein
MDNFTLTASKYALVSDKYIIVLSYLILCVLHISDGMRLFQGDLSKKEFWKF